MEVNHAQKFFLWSSDLLFQPPRNVLYNVEIATRPATPTLQKIEKIALAFFWGVVSLISSVPAIILHSLSICTGCGSWELIKPATEIPSFQGKALKFASLNAALQNPYCPFTAGVVNPFDRLSPYPHRIAGLVEKIAEENYDLFAGQEFEDLGSQEEFIWIMEAAGYRYFIRDLGTNTMLNRSGLFIASKYPIDQPKFTPFLWDDKAGLAEFSKLGILTFTMSLNGKEQGFLITHLNYGDDEKCQTARETQISKFILPYLQKGYLVLGDFNCDTSQITQLKDYTNELEGKTTCSDEGKHTLRGKPGPCPDCNEKIDVIIHDSNTSIISAKATQLYSKQFFLSDHFLVTGELLCSDH